MSLDVKAAAVSSISLNSQDYKCVVVAFVIGICMACSASKQLSVAVSWNVNLLQALCIKSSTADWFCEDRQSNVLRCVPPSSWAACFVQFALKNVTVCWRLVGYPAHCCLYVRWSLTFGMLFPQVKRSTKYEAVYRSDAAPIPGRTHIYVYLLQMTKVVRAIEGHDTHVTSVSVTLVIVCIACKILAEPMLVWYVASK